MKLAAYIASLAMLAFLLIGCNDTSSHSTTVIKKIKQQTIVFEDDSELALSDKEVKQVFYLVRHAEKDTIPANDPTLTPKGEKRSEALADIFKQSRIDAIYSTLFLRTLLTADSLSKAKGINILPYDPSELKSFAESLKQNNQVSTAMIVGHSNTTPTLVSFLADKDSSLFPHLDESVYDKLFIVIIHKDGTTDVKELNYYTG